MAAKCCIVGCPFKSAKIPLLPIPNRDAPNYKLWVIALHRSNTNIQELKNPLVCAMHFVDRTVRLTGKVTEKHYPLQYLSTDEINTILQNIESINQLVAEWLSITRRSKQGTKVDDGQLIAKAKELLSILKLFHVDIDFGWIESFKEYALKNGIEPWKKSTDVGSTRKVVKVKPVRKYEEPAKDLESIKSISTYKQALDMVELLEDYVRRTKNSDAIELIAHVQEVITKSAE